MGNRLSKIYTRTGDDGTTSLGDGRRIAKDHLRVESYGILDELNSTLGMVLSHSDVPENLREIFIQIQHELFDLGSELCLPGYHGIHAHHIEWLETTLDELNSHLKPLKEFLLPGGHAAAASCHVARTICRRAERVMVALSHCEQVQPYGLMYINRLSDLLFVLARTLNQYFAVEEPLWKHERIKKKP